MALLFPNNPQLDDIFETDSGAKYKYDGSKWVFTPFDTTVNAHTSLDPPPDPKDGNLWWDTETGTLYIYYVTDTSEQWVHAVITDASCGLPPQVGKDGKYLMTNGERVYWGNIGIPTIDTPVVTLTGSMHGDAVDLSKDIQFDASVFNSSSLTYSSTEWLIEVSGDTVYHIANDTNVLVLPGNTLQYTDQSVKIRVRYFSNGNVFSDWGELLFTLSHPMQPLNTDNLTTDIQLWQYDSATDTGYYGFVSTDELIAGNVLATQIGLTAGTEQYSTSGWFKFYVGHNASCNRTSPKRSYVIYVASMPYRYELSWDNINSVTAVYGDRVETIGSHDYYVRLIQGATTDPTATSYGTICMDDAGLDSEWNELFYRIHIDNPNCINVNIGMSGGNETSRHGGSQSAEDNWTEYTNDQTGVLNTSTNGSACWAQETDGIDTSRSVIRGRYGLASWTTGTSNGSNGYLSICGWRPVLELVN